MSDNTELKNKIESAWENIAKISPKDTDIADAVNEVIKKLDNGQFRICLLYTSPSPRDPKTSRMPSSA